MKSLFVSFALLLVSHSLVQAQSGPTYRAQSGSHYWVSDNPFRLYLVRGSDTIPAPVRGISVFRETWLDLGEELQLVRASVDVGLSDRTRTDTMRVSLRGTVLTINGDADYGEGEWDALLRLPNRPLSVGVEWTDTIAHPTTGPRANGLFRVERGYQVSRDLAAEGGVGLEIIARGSIQFNLSMWTDSAAGQYRWFELSGATNERFVFDPGSGQLLARSWSMHLEGLGGDFDGERSDTVAAGLRSSNERYRIPEARAVALMAGLPGADSSISFRDGEVPLFVHTMGREANRIVEGFRRADGLVASSQVVLSERTPMEWEFKWVDLQEDPRTVVYKKTDGSLSWGEERRQPPTAAWAVAEYGMAGSLVPSLQVVPDTQRMSYSIYRPTADRWDELALSSRTFEGVRLFVLQPRSGGQTVLLVSDSGVLLYEEANSPDGSRIIRVPTTTHGQAALRSALQVVQGGG